MKALLPWLAGVMILLVLAGWGSERTRTRHLQRQLERLSADLAAAKSQRPEAALVSPTGLSAAEVERLRSDAAEVHRLRNEVNHLRRAASLPADGDAPTPGARGPGPTPGKNPGWPDGFWTTEQLTFAGYATPEATIQSLVWALREGDTPTLLACLTPEEGERMREQWGDKSPAEISQENRQMTEKIRSLQILESAFSGDGNQAVVKVFAAGGDDRVQALTLKRVGADWKFAGSNTD